MILGLPGVIFLAVAVRGMRQGSFPFRPRSGYGSTPPAGSRHSGLKCVSRLDEPELFWTQAGTLFTTGVVCAASSVWFAVKLYTTGAP